MAYEIKVTPDAELDLRHLRKAEQQVIRDGLPRHLVHQPASPSRKRRLRDPNPYDAAWELRLGDLRVLYAIDEPAQVVRILRVGCKEGNRLSIRGVPVEMRLP